MKPTVITTDPTKMAAIYAKLATQSHAEAVHSIQAQNTPSPFAEIQRLQDEQREGWAPPLSLQSRVHPWLIACFGAEIAGDKKERNHRFLEEAIELVQSTGCTQSESHQLVDYVFNRPVGEPHQEVGGVMITLAALCLANGLDMDVAGEDELARIWTKVEKIRAKQAAKPKHSPLAEECNSPYYQQQLAEKDAKIAEQAAQIVALRGCLEHLTTKDWFTDIDHPYDGVICKLDAAKVRLALSTPAPPVAPLEDVRPLVEALTRYDCHDCLTTEQQQDANDTLKTFTTKHPL